VSMRSFVTFATNWMDVKWHLLLLLVLICVAGPETGLASFEHHVTIVSDSVLWHQQSDFDRQVVLLRQHGDLLPLKHYRTKRQLNIVAGGGFSPVALDSCWQWYSMSDYHTLSGRPNYLDISGTALHGEPYDLIILHLAPVDGHFTPQLMNLAEMMPYRERVVLVVYGDEAVAERIHHLQDYGAVILAHAPHEAAMSSVVRGIFGGIPFQGRTAGGRGITTAQTRINFGTARAPQVPPERFHAIDSIVEDALRRRVFPGCQVMAVHKGNVVFEKSYGSHTPDGHIPVTPTDIYDLASLTKILTTTAALIQLHHAGVIDIDGHLGDYLTMARGTNKEKLIISDILLHRARLQSWIPFYRSLMVDGRPDTAIFNRDPSFDFPVRVADSMWIRAGYEGVVLRQILESPLRRNNNYVYSDLGMILLKYMIEEQTMVPFEEYLEDSVYNPLNLYNTGFNPRRHHPLHRLVPTEADDYFRHELLHGYVHDQAAAMLGGVAGHAGLFSTARDVAVLMYTLANGGSYGGVQVFHPEAIEKFNRRPHSRLRRGLGFDKPEPSSSARPNVTRMASPSSFGHAGFTGTFAWADPENELIYVFLSNRVHPTANNPLLTQLGIRVKIHEVLYQALQ
jgi:beta-N-acetylhexosaminidase